jgi:hypothetical protein
MEIEAPDVKSGGTQFIAPRAAIEAMRDGQCGWKSRPMHIQDDAAVAHLFRRRQVASEQRQSRVPTGESDMLFSQIEQRWHSQCSLGYAVRYAHANATKPQQLLRPEPKSAAANHGNGAVLTRHFRPDRRGI